MSFTAFVIQEEDGPTYIVDYLEEAETTIAKLNAIDVSFYIFELGKERKDLQ